MLKEIFDSITPEHIKSVDNKLIQDAMDIFIDNLELNADISVDLKKMYEMKNQSIKEEMLKIYLDDLFKIFSEARKNRPILDKLNEINRVLGSDITPDDFLSNVTSILNKEHFIASKNFKEKKGTKVSIEYIYNLVASLGIITDSANEFKLTPISPFEFEVEGSLYKEVYDQMVKPLAHPLGFTYTYLYILDLLMNDYFMVSYEYTNTKMYITCLENNALINFVGDTITNPLFNNGVPTEPIYQYSEVTAVEELIEGARTIKRVYFSDGSHVTAKTDPISIIHYSTDEEDSFFAEAPKIKTYTEHCSISLSRNLQAVSKIDDSYLIIDSDHLLVDTMTMDDYHHILVDFNTMEHYSYATDDGYIGFMVSEYSTIEEGPNQQGTIGLRGSTTISGVATDVYNVRSNAIDEIDVVTMDPDGYIGFVIGKTFIGEPTSEGILGEFAII